WCHRYARDRRLLEVRGNRLGNAANQELDSLRSYQRLSEHFASYVRTRNRSTDASDPLLHCCKDFSCHAKATLIPEFPCLSLNSPLSPRHMKTRWRFII